MTLPSRLFNPLHGQTFDSCLCHFDFCAGQRFAWNLRFAQLGKSCGVGCYSSIARRFPVDSVYIDPRLIFPSIAVGTQLFHFCISLSLRWDSREAIDTDPLRSPPLLILPLAPTVGFPHWENNWWSVRQCPSYLLSSYPSIPMAYSLWYWLRHAPPFIGDLLYTYSTIRTQSSHERIWFFGQIWGTLIAIPFVKWQIEIFLFGGRMNADSTTIHRTPLV